MGAKVKERQHFLDVLRVAATCAVVLLHTVTGVWDMTDMSSYPLENKVFFVVMDLVCWSVPLFIMISGYLFLDPEREISFARMVSKYCRRILLALFMFGVPYAWMELLMTERSFRPGMIGEGFVKVLKGQSWSHMWYLYLIFFLYLLTPALRWLLKRMPLWAVQGIWAVLFVCCSILPFFVRLSVLPETYSILPDNMIYFFYYVSGYLFAVRNRREKPLWPYLPLLAAALMLGMAGSRIWGGFTLQMAYNYPFTVLLAMALFGTGLLLSQRKTKKNTVFWETASALSFGVYLIHPVFLNVSYKLLGITPLSFSIWLSLPLLFLGTLLLATVTAWILRKIPPLRKYVL